MSLPIADTITAQLAKEKGFDRPVEFVYLDESKDSDYVLYHLNYYEGDGSGVVKNSELDSSIGTKNAVATAPSLYKLKEWLREDHHIEVYLIPGHAYVDEELDKQYTVWISYNEDGRGARIPEVYKEHNQALECGLIHVISELSDK